MLFLQYDLPFVAFFVVRCIAFSIIDICNVFVTLTSFTDFIVILHGWMIFCIKTISRLSMANKGCIIVVLTVRILINRFRFFKISRMAGNSTNEKFVPERLLIYFLVIER
jgi:hypothetical protein